MSLSSKCLAANASPEVAEEHNIVILVTNRGFESFF